MLIHSALNPQARGAQVAIVIVVEPGSFLRYFQEPSAQRKGKTERREKIQILTVPRM